MTELSAYVFSALRDGQFTLHRGICEGVNPVLVVAPTGEYPSPAALQRIEHEYALRVDLDPDWAARPVALIRGEIRPTLVLEDPGGEPLDRLLGQKLDIATFLRIAIPLAAAVGQAHASGLIHRDLKPANILVDTGGGGVWLTGFGIASRLPREHQPPVPPEVIAGTLAYMAPEQTGRMNRSIDARSDLYSLGVTLYEMLTGTLPFTAADPMEWVHCHIARQPIPPAELDPAIPPPLSAIVMKLLAKTAEDRYQTAAGLTTDLRHCLAQWEATGRIAPFPLGRQDVPDRLLIPERLYGREHEIGTLLASFDRVVAHGTPELVLVSGYSGIGKSSVVNELHKVLVPPRGLFASGKFDQYRRDIPYTTMAQAFQTLVRQILGMDEMAVCRCQDELREALAPNGQLIVNLIPELELVIGKQPPVPDLPPRDAQNRFQMVFRRFLGVFARPEHPLALFLDDLQWLDTATLDLLEHLVTHSEVRHLLLVGAYRDNEVGPAHPLMRTLAAIRSADARVHEIVLAPLGLDDVGQLVADALHCEAERARPLARLVQEKTGGNPFFAIQFLTALADEALLAFDPVAPAWQWDIDRIRAKSHTDNVVELMAGKLNRLPDATQEGLKQLACLGNVAHIATLTMIHGQSEQVIHSALWDAVHAGFIVQTDGAYKFQHDRIQQAAYSLIPEEQRAGIHLRIGRVLLASLTADQLAEHLFDVAGQLNRGAARLIGRDEKARVATIDLRAGRKAKASAAYASAHAYFATGTTLLDERDWTSQYELTFSLWLERAECELLCGNFEKTEQLIGELLHRGASKVDLASVYQLKIQFNIMRSENQQAVASALTCLRLFGIDLPAHPTQEQAQAEYEAVWQTLDGRPPESLIDLPLMTDPELQAAMDVLSVLTPSAYFTDFQLFCLLACRMVKVGMQHGISGAFTLGYALLGLFILGPVFHRYREGYRFVKLACDLVEKHGFIAYQAKVYHAMGAVAFWTQPLETAIHFMRTTFRAAIETGDLTFACTATYQSVTGLLLRNDPLDAVWRELETALDFVRNARFHDIADIVVCQQRFIATMQGRTATFSTFSDAQFDETLFDEARFDEATFEAKLTAGRTSMMICYYWILKLKARFLSGDYAEALAAAGKAKPLLSAAAAKIQLLDYFTYTALTVTALYENASARQQTEWRNLLAEHCEQLREWVDNYPPTFADKHALVSAEIARLEARDTDAMYLYQQAIQSARENGFVQDQGLAHEVAARFYAARGFETIAYAYLRNARYCYLRWGAAGKVRQLDQRYPRLGEEPASSASTETIGAPVGQLDIGAVTKASQAISGEIVLGRLVETLMTIALEDAGAERGLLVLLRGDTPRIEAEARTGRQAVEVTLRQETVTPAHLPVSLLHIVVRTRQSVILDDASAQNPFSADEYLRRKHARSVLCLPLVEQTELIGVLYLENNLAPHVFTPARIAVLELLSSQAAISLENARLYAELIHENHERRMAEDALRASEERWRNLFESAPVGVALIGPHGRYVATNPAFQQMIGYAEADLRRRSPADITHEDDRATTEAIIRARVAGDPVTHRVEKRYRRSDGGVIWAEVSTFSVPIVGSAPLFAAAVVDITDRKRAEEDLRRSEASLTEAQRISHTGNWRWNVGTGWVTGSVEHFRIFGFDPAATHSSYPAFLDRVHPDDRPSLEQTIDRAVRERSIFDVEYRIVLPDRSVRHLQTMGHPAIADTADLEFVGTVMDITSRKHADEALRNLQAELAHVARLTTMGELAASLAHEISQPLAAIVAHGNAGLHWLSHDKPAIDEVRDSLSRIVQDGVRAADVIRGLRALVMKSEPRLIRLDIDETIREVLALARGELQRHLVVLHTDLSAGDQPIRGDRIQLQQVLLNLIMNAIHAMRGVTDRMRELTVSSALTDPGSVLVAVEDTGTGLDPAIAQRIFEPFFTTKPDGLGMGLSICRSLVEAHGGHLWATPRTPHGTALRFTVPIGKKT